jgi:hypothetical protein
VPTIIRDLPYSDQETIVTVRGREYPVFSYQIVLWVSVTPQPVETFDPNTPRFPAVFDTGFTDNFLIGSRPIAAVDRLATGTPDARWPPSCPRGACGSACGQRLAA